MELRRATQTIYAVDIKPGMVVKKLRDQTAGRCAIESVELLNDEGKRAQPGESRVYAWVCFAYSSRRCTAQCADDPVNCPHMDGSAGGGSGRIPCGAPVEVYTGEVG